MLRKESDSIVIFYYPETSQRPSSTQALLNINYHLFLIGHFGKQLRLTRDNFLVEKHIENPWDRWTKDKVGNKNISSDMTYRFAFHGWTLGCWQGLAKQFIYFSLPVRQHLVCNGRLNICLLFSTPNCPPHMYSQK